MGDTVDPVEPLVKLGRKLKDLCAPLGIDMQFVISPNLDGGPHGAQAFFFLPDDYRPPEDEAQGEAPGPEDLPDEERQRDAEILAEIERGEEKALKEAAADEVAAKLAAMQERLKKPGGGILED